MKYLLRFRDNVGNEQTVIDSNLHHATCLMMINRTQPYDKNTKVSGGLPPVSKKKRTNSTVRTL